SENIEQCREYHNEVIKSPLFDEKLKMFKVNADLTGQSEEIGRTRIFPRGWLENESVWLHMEYKYMLELIRKGLEQEFYAHLKDVLVPFLDARTYGRCILENSSFIVSSAHEDKALHGQGFVARLSGSTAELMHIWLLMNIGERPFVTNTNKALVLQFQPSLAAWLFTEKPSTIEIISDSGQWEEVLLPENTYAFNFLGQILVVYHNPGRKDTFGKQKAQIERIEISYPQKKNKTIISGHALVGDVAEDVRNRKVQRIDVFLV
ncbi:MAG: hypothetical protein KC713_09810, partial [Candidatus Omnitrophica bacterium]|nr:hypothetical protein [Candidatus Omnitrophota bacterium]